MYESFYGLKEKPFSLTPDPKFLYLSKQHQGALDHMLYGIKQKEGFMTIVGDVGTGKTTLCRCLLDRLDSSVQVALILNPMLSDIDLLRTCLYDLRIEPSLYLAHTPVDVIPGDTGEMNQSATVGSNLKSIEEKSLIDCLSKKELIDVLNAFLLKQHEENKSTVLIIDEAQNLSFDVMEQVRILSNLETEKEKLLQIIFVGQLELTEKLNRPELKQLNQRISIRYQIPPLTREETYNYVSHRVMIAGTVSRIRFNSSALKTIYNYSKGYPRLINLVSDRALLSAFNAQTDSIEAGHVKQGIKSLSGVDAMERSWKELIKENANLAFSILFFIGGLIFFFSGQSDNKDTNLNKELTSPILQPDKPENSTEVKTKTISTKSTANVQVPQNSQPSNPVKNNYKEDYRIQVYAFSKQKKAEKNAQILQAEGFKTYWKKINSSGQIWYVVYVGPFGTITEAKPSLKRLKTSGREPLLLSLSNSG
jgi:general secretion pathway protein A